MCTGAGEWLMWVEVCMLSCVCVFVYLWHILYNGAWPQSPSGMWDFQVQNRPTRGGGRRQQEQTAKMEKGNRRIRRRGRRRRNYENVFFSSAFSVQSAHLLTRVGMFLLFTAMPGCCGATDGNWPSHYIATVGLQCRRESNLNTFSWKLYEFKVTKYCIYTVECVRLIIWEMMHM